MRIRRTPPCFPPVEAAGPDGVVLVGGLLERDWMLEAYRRGIFPMPVRVQGQRVVAWLSPDPRGILPFGGLHISRRLARRLRRGEFQFTVDRAFADVVRGCAASRGGPRHRWLTIPLPNTAACTAVNPPVESRAK
jgi:leucyl/phenylalanyl-tRNA---protein transferase